MTAMAAALALIGLNIADALLLRINLQLTEVDLNPLVPPFEANLAARGLIAIAVILTLYVIEKRDLIEWFNLAVIGLIGYHALDRYIASFIVYPR